MIVELHMLQNFAPSCLNRDDTNTPKDCEFGGYRRARISSQCIKFAVRWNRRLRAAFEGMFALRSDDHARQVAEVISKRQEGARPLEKALPVARYMLQRMGFKEKAKTGRLTVMLLLGADEIESLADAAIQSWDDLEPLANEALLRERLADRVAGLLGDDGDAVMLGRLIANFKAGSANATELALWLAKGEGEWPAVIDAARELPEEKRLELREKYEVDADDGDEDNEDGGEEFVPKAAASLFKKATKGTANPLIDALKLVNVDREGRGGPKSPRGEAASASSKQLKAAFAGLKKLTTTAVNVALFGRMLAEIKSGDMNVDAACQVAHAISTNSASIEMDYFTAVNELKELARKQGAERGSGAGMIGSVEFNSSCFYRYSSVDTSELAKNVGHDATLARKVVLAFLRASVEAIPTGKQNSFAAHNPPDFVMAVVRPHGQTSLANAFVEPVRATEQQSLVEASVSKLDKYWGASQKILARPNGETVAFVRTTEGEMPNLKKCELSSLEEVLAAVARALGGPEEAV